MRFQLMCTSILTVCLAGWSAPCRAQNVQNWLQNEAGRIQQGYGSGAITQGQAGQLQNEEAQIVSQDQRYLQQNGGKLTAQQQGQIGSELRNLNRQYKGTLGSNYANGNSNAGFLSNFLGGRHRNYNPSPYQGGYPMSPYGSAYPSGMAYPNPNMYQYNSAYPQMSPQQQSSFARYYRRQLQQQGF